MQRGASGASCYRTRVKLALAFVLVLGCHKGGGDSFDELVAELDGFKTQMCACTSQQCAEKVAGPYEAWKKSRANPAIARQPAMRAPEPYRTKWATIELDLISCEHKLTKREQ